MKNRLDMEINESQLSDLVLYKHKWLTSSSLLILYKYKKKNDDLEGWPRKEW